ncbi:SDR family oxidoreductase [Kineococcus sp. T13]|uniref:SDR family NAD(P)-dependent oxidoreductase n=1 Tax=Kineococcus vitellinus TaxID=2696565 RepID=UPI001413374F|nr:SDR family oxidoreductase [Kineococcus vitellinus]NAZ76962.1 SDR family oxidoreductase [Kineococcus vitellinus]
MDTRFSQDVVLITGATGGMGSSHARGYHAEGARVVLAGRRDDAGRALADELGAGAAFVHLDVTDPADWVRAVAAAEEAFGPVTVLVNNAGLQTPPAPIEHTDPATWARALAVNTTGPFLGIRAVAPSLRRAGGGSVVNIVSTMANVGTAGFAPYTAAKWAVRGLTRTAALELGRDGIRVNSVHPGVVSTPFVHDPVPGSDVTIADAYSPDAFAVPRLGRPREVTDLLLWLTSREAGFVTGAEFVVDGGLLLGPAMRVAEPAGA